jgi:hypothetical protein
MTNREHSVSKSLISGLLPILVTTLSVPSLWGQANVLTWHNDAARTGQNLQETILSPSNVNSTNFGLMFAPLATDGKVDAQPLYVPALGIAGGTHNVLYVATENDTVYAFDADSGAQLWSQTVLLAGETASDDRGCSQVTPQIGITSTPVIDLTSGPHGTIYLVAMSKDGSGNYHQRLHALDMFTHTEEFGGPIDIQATYPSTGPQSSGGVVTFDPKQYKDRAALLLSKGVIYTSWASHCDADPYSAWIIGYNESNLAQVSVLNLTPNGAKGSIWQAGAGPAADASGDLYFLMANGTFDTTLNANGFPSQGDYGNAFMNLSTTSGLAVADYFTMDNTVSESNGDVDLGSGGAMLLPALNDAQGNPHELAVGAGKDGNAYVVDRNNMGKYNGSSNAVYQQLALGGSVFSSPAWFNNTMYYGPVGQQLQAFQYSGGSFSLSSQTSLPNGFGNRGTTPSISANGNTNGIVWAVQGGSTAVLYAFDASNLSELYDSTQAANSRDSFGTGITFTTPTVANGKVFVGTTSGVAVFGQLGCSYSLANSLSIDSTATSGSVTVTANPSTCTWSAVNNSNFVTITGITSGSNGAVTFSVPANPGATRTGVLVIAGQEFTITQGGLNSLSPAPANPTPVSGSGGALLNQTLGWTGTNGATSYDVYFGTSQAPPLVGNTSSTSYAPGALTPGITYYWKVIAKNSAGTSSSPVWLFTTSNARVAAVSVTPNSGSGASHSFALQYSDTAGAGNVQAVYVWFNTALTGSGGSSCLLSYQPSTNQLNLLNDGATGWLGATLGAATTLQNSQCSVNVAAATAVPSGNMLTLTLPMTFKAAYAGAKNIYMYDSDISGANSGWQQEGTWTVSTSSGVPATVSVAPSSGSGASQTFALQYSDTAGAGNLGFVYVWFNTNVSGNGSSSCLLSYQPSTNQLSLFNDGATAWLAATLGAAATLQNSQCSVNVATATAVPSGNTLTLNLAMTFKAGYAGAKNIYMYGSDASGANSGWQQEGAWTVSAGSGVPSTVSVTPSSGSGTSQTFALQYSDTAGAGNLSFVYAWFNTTVSGNGSSSCLLSYQPSTNQLSMFNDGATAWLAGTLGAATTLQNSQCSVNVATATAVRSGNTLTLNLAMTFQAAYAGVKNVSMFATDSSGSNTGWQQEGAWTVSAGSGVPATVSVTPSSGSGSSQTFALQYSDTAGAGNLAFVYVWFNTNVSGNGSSSCLLSYQPSTNQLSLFNDGATAWLAATLGAATTLQNSQCSVNMATATAVHSGNMLTLNLAMTFKAAYAGAQNIYMYDSDLSGSNSGWQQEGTWTVSTGAGVPATVSVTPSSGSGANQTFALQFSDTAGAGNLSFVYVWFNTNVTGNGSNSCLLSYQPSTNQLSLFNDGATAWLAATLGAATTLQNSQCSVNMATATAVPSGNTLTLTLPMTFQPAYAGAKNIYMYDSDVSGANSGWQQEGAWTAP